MRGHRWTRRGLLALGVAAAGGFAVRSPASATIVSIDRLDFTVPPEIEQVPSDETLGRHWQWTGRDLGAKLKPATVVLARADLLSSDPVEILGLLLAVSVTGSLANLTLGTRRTSAMPGGGDQTRIDMSYDAARGLAFHGTLLVATRREPPAGLIVVIGGDALTAGTIDAVLDSARWQE